MKMCEFSVEIHRIQIEIYKIQIKIYNIEIKICKIQTKNLNFPITLSKVQNIIILFYIKTIITSVIIIGAWHTHVII